MFIEKEHILRGFMFWASVFLFDLFIGQQVVYLFGMFTYDDKRNDLHIVGYIQDFSDLF